MITFSLEKHGYDTPVQLVQLPSNEPMLKLPQGLNGVGIISEKAFVLQGFQRLGVRIPSDEVKKYPQIGNRQFILPKQEGFGRAFYELYFPKLAKTNPDNYQWYLLDGKA